MKDSVQGQHEKEAACIGQIQAYTGLRDMLVG